MLQLHLSDQQFNCLRKCVLYYRLDGIVCYVRHIRDMQLDHIEKWDFRKLNQIKTAEFWSVTFCMKIDLGQKNYFIQIEGWKYPTLISIKFSFNFMATCSPTQGHVIGYTQRKHRMSTYPRYWPFVRRIHWSPVDSPHKVQWRGALMFSLNCTWINGKSWGWWYEMPSRRLWRQCNG